VTTRGRFDLNLGPMLEALANAEQDVDAAVAETLEANKYLAIGMAFRRLRETSEEWTGAAAKTLYVEGPLREGNYTYIELGAHTSQDPAAFYKEFGKPRQSAEPWLRPTLDYYRRGGLKAWMQTILERYGLKA
jgi:hypothetical protein